MTVSMGACDIDTALVRQGRSVSVLDGSLRSRAGTVSAMESSPR